MPQATANKVDALVSKKMSIIQSFFKSVLRWLGYDRLLLRKENALRAKYSRIKAKQLKVPSKNKSLCKKARSLQLKNAQLQKQKAPIFRQLDTWTTEDMRTRYLINFPRYSLLRSQGFSHKEVQGRLGMEKVIYFDALYDLEEEIRDNNAEINAATIAQGEEVRRVEGERDSELDGIAHKISNLVLEREAIVQ